MQMKLKDLKEKILKLKLDEAQIYVEVHINETRD